MTIPRDQRTIEKYLTTYAEPEARWTEAQLETLPAGNWDYVITIPACGEDQYLPGALQSINQCQAVQNNQRVLCIVVLNGNKSREAEFRLSNEKMRSWFENNCTTIADPLNSQGNCPQRLLSWQSLEILVIDRSLEPWLPRPSSDRGYRLWSPGRSRSAGPDDSLVRPLAQRSGKRH